MEADELTENVIGANTAGLLKIFTGKEWESDNSPQVGDFFLRRSEDGHTGVVTAVNNDGTMEITHAAGEKKGTISQTRVIENYIHQVGWRGFFRPTSTKKSSDGATATSETPAALVGSGEFDQIKEDPID